jgi:hypothetical protein
MIQKREYFDISMDTLRVEPDMRKELWQRVKSGASVDDKALKQISSKSRAAQLTIAEQRLLELLFTDEDLRHAILPRMEAEDYEGLPTAAIFRALIEIEEAGETVDFSALSAKTEDDPVAADLVPLLLMSEPQRAEGEAVDDQLANAESCLTALRLIALDRRITELGAEIAAAERAGEMERRDRLALEHLGWTRRRGALLLRAEAAHHNF